MRQKVEEAGGTVHMKSEIVEVHRNGHRILAVTIKRDGQEQCIPGDDFISSMPLTEFIQRLDPPAPPEILAASRKLKYRDFLTVCLIVKTTELFPDNWIYIHDPRSEGGPNPELQELESRHGAGPDKDQPGPGVLLQRRATSCGRCPTAS